MMTQLLSLCTAGSVDDGKSTLIGQLLYQTNSIPDDKWAEIEQASLAKGLDFMDLSLLTDGLIVEREKGITIDVAYIYFSTKKRKYILADTPGHFEYTRNMITGASQSQVCLIMIDAKRGLTEQTHRHIYIACLLGLQEVIFCINKMDLVAYQQFVFEQYIADLQTLITTFDTKKTRFSFVPISAFEGENIVYPTQKMLWYKSDALLQILEKIEIREAEKPVRFFVQNIIKMNDFQGVAGKLVSGNLQKGDTLFLLQKEKHTQISAIYKGEKKIDTATAGESLLLEIAPFIEVERGECLTIKNDILPGKKEFFVQLCWLDEAEAQICKSYLLQQSSFATEATILAIEYVVNITTQEKKVAYSLKMNDIAIVSVQTEKPIFIDSFEENPANGRFILIDKNTFHTVALGLVK